jgi:hypothetical protein
VWRDYTANVALTPGPSPNLGRGERELVICVGGLDNRFEHGIDTVNDVEVVESQYLISANFEVTVTGFILRALVSVDFTVEFDDQTMARAIEVDDERPDCVLASELKAVQVPISKE